MAIKLKIPKEISPVDLRRQDAANFITHAVAAVFSLGAAALMVAMAVMKGNVRHVVSFSVFGAAMVILFTVSSLFHAFERKPAGRVLEKMDLAAIFLLIAGTYTPFTLVTLYGPVGWGLFSAIWLLALLGMFRVLFFKGKGGKLLNATYLAMGWLIVLVMRPLAAHLPLPGLALLAAGGVAYTVGVFIFTRETLRYHHAIFHLFVMLGAFLHFLAVLGYVLPDLR